MKSFKTVIESVSQRELDDLEKFGDRLLNKFDIDIEFTRHFADRLNDKRNKPAIDVEELKTLFKKMADNKGKKIKKHGNSEVILKDMQADLNLPVVINWKNGEFEVVNKTIMRKKGFKSPDPMLKYESVEEERNYRKEYDNYHKDPIQVKRRAKRNEARRSLRGRKDLTDDKDVHHKDNDPMNNDPSNLAIVTQHYNRREPRLRKEETATVKTIQDIIKESGARRLTNRLKKGGVDLDKRAKERAASHAALVKKYASDKKEEVDEMKDDPCWKDHEMVGHKMKNGKKVPNCVPKESVKEARSIKIAKGDKTRTVNKQELSTYKQMGWKVVAESALLDEAISVQDIKKLDGKTVSPTQWKTIRTSKDIKKISMLGKTGSKGSTKHGVIFKDTTSIDIFVESTLVEAKQTPLEQMQDIVKNKQAKKIGGVMVDMFTASTITQAYAKVNPTIKAKMEKSSLDMLVGLAQKMMGMKESALLDEETFYIDFLNKKKGFKQDRIKFKSHDAAVKWAKKNLGKFNSDMIKTESVNLGVERDFFAIREATKKN